MTHRDTTTTDLTTEAIRCAERLCDLVPTDNLLAHANGPANALTLKARLTQAVRELARRATVDAGNQINLDWRGIERDRLAFAARGTDRDQAGNETRT